MFKSVFKGNSQMVQVSPFPCQAECYCECWCEYDAGAAWWYTANANWFGNAGADNISH